MNELVDSAEKGILEDRIYAVYVSPLKALNNDIRKNLVEPSQEIEEIEREMMSFAEANDGDVTDFPLNERLEKLVEIYKFADSDDKELMVQVHVYEQVRRKLLELLNE